MKELIAKGKDIDGKTHEFTIKNGYIHCYGNQLTDLILPEGVEKVYCWDNQLTELIIPMGVKTVNCHGNQITHLDLPESVTYLICDKDLTGLEIYVGKVKMDLV